MPLPVLPLPVLAALIAFALSVPAHAETKVLTAEATYMMGDGETPTVAETRALHNAKRMAVEQAGTYLRSYTRAKNFQLTDDELQAIAGALIEAEVLDKQRTVVGEGFRFWVKIKASVTTEKADELMGRLKEKEFRNTLVNEHKESQAKYERLEREVALLKNQLQQAGSDVEKKKVANEIAKSERRYVLLLKSATFYLIGRVLGLKHQAGANEVFYEWNSEVQSEGGVTRTCSVNLRAFTLDLRVVNMTWNLFAKIVGPDRIESMSLLKVEVHQMNHEDVLQDSHPVKVFNAWIKSSTGTTVGRLTADDSQHYFLGGAAKIDLFGELLDGIVTDGLVLGYQDKPGGFDTRIKIAEPLSNDAATRLLMCIDSLRQDTLGKSPVPKKGR